MLFLQYLRKTQSNNIKTATTAKVMSVIPQIGMMSEQELSTHLSLSQSEFVVHKTPPHLFQDGYFSSLS